jgi:uncharacterized membrane-anchored protein
MNTNVKTVGKQMLNKVPEITLYFWIIKILCTTVGETFSDFLSDKLNLGLTITSVVMAVVLIIVLVFQFRAKKYVPSVYWLLVVLISIVGTLITDNLSDNLGVSLFVSTAVFAVLLAVTFIIWYMKERTLSVHSIITKTRESFYWLVILFTFALGTAVGDLISEQFNLGYLVGILLFSGCIALVAVAHYRFKLNAVLSFWMAYVLTRPLGASIGDYLSQTHTDGGLGIGPTTVSIIFLLLILLTVIYLSVTKKDLEVVDGI